MKYRIDLNNICYCCYCFVFRSYIWSYRNIIKEKRTTMTKNSFFFLSLYLAKDKNRNIAIEVSKSNLTVLSARRCRLHLWRKKNGSAINGLDAYHQNRAKRCVCVRDACSTVVIGLNLSIFSLLWAFFLSNKIDHSNSTIGIFSITIEFKTSTAKKKNC